MNPTTRQCFISSLALAVIIIALSNVACSVLFTVWVPATFGRDAVYHLYQDAFVEICNVQNATELDGRLYLSFVKVRDASTLLQETIPLQLTSPGAKDYLGLHPCWTWGSTTTLVRRTPSAEYKSMAMLLTIVMAAAPVLSAICGSLAVWVL